MTKESKTNVKLTLDDVMCPVCLDILIEPVTLACHHELCKECYTLHFEMSDFSCPLCKKRLNSWARKAITKGTLINQQKWAQIKEQFADLVECRKNGDCNPAFTHRSPANFRIAKPGELQEEYKKLKQEWLTEQTEERRQEEEASIRLINQIREEEKVELEKMRKEQQEKDEKLARQLSEDLEMNVSPSKVNQVILRPRRLLSPISENTPSSSRQRRRLSYAKPTKVASRKRKRAASTSSN